MTMKGKGHADSGRGVAIAALERSAIQGAMLEMADALAAQYTRARRLYVRARALPGVVAHKRLSDLAAEESTSVDYEILGTLACLIDDGSIQGDVKALRSGGRLTPAALIQAEAHSGRLRRKVIG